MSADQRATHKANILKIATIIPPFVTFRRAGNTFKCRSFKIFKSVNRFHISVKKPVLRIRIRIRISQRYGSGYGSGSFSHEANIVRKTLLCRREFFYSKFLAAGSRI
jgi:hypothetical protein